MINLKNIKESYIEKIGFDYYLSIHIDDEWFNIVIDLDMFKQLLNKKEKKQDDIRTNN